MFVQVSAYPEQPATATEHKRSRRGRRGRECGSKKILLFILLCCLISLQGISDAQSMRSSKENQGESILAQLTEIKRLRRALASGIMEYGISPPASRQAVASTAGKSASSLVPELCTSLYNVLSFSPPLA